VHSYRFRLIAMVCHPNYVFSIDGHSFTIIEADGVNTQPVLADSIQIYAGTILSSLFFNENFMVDRLGQRYSFIVRCLLPSCATFVDRVVISSTPTSPSTITASLPLTDFLHLPLTLCIAGIRANPNMGYIGFLDGINSAILRYKDAPALDPVTTQQPSLSPLVETSLVVSAFGRSTPGPPCDRCPF
jgi:iron transport multicopper oxidase